MTAGHQTRVTAKTRFKDMPCRECGEPVSVGSNTRNAPRCVECGIAAGAEAIRQMVNRSGVYFDRWIQGCKVYADQAARGAPGSSE